jgi:hypothetical protein
VDGVDRTSAFSIDASTATGVPEESSTTAGTTSE